LQCVLGDLKDLKEVGLTEFLAIAKPCTESAEETVDQHGRERLVGCSACNRIPCKLADLSRDSLDQRRKTGFIHRFFRIREHAKCMNFKHRGIVSGLLLIADLVVAETKIPFSDLPVPVQSAAKKQLHAARIIGASSEKEDGRTIYEVETTVAAKAVI
jgi:hypothetical protein